VKKRLESRENSTTLFSKTYKLAVLRHTPVSARTDSSEACNCLMRVEVVEMVAEQRAF